MLQAVQSAIKNTGKKSGPNMEITDHGPNTGFYGPHVDQS